ncbi:hypothetical protein ZIOFF_060731 [Zingiber officinale]|uniref:Cytokinin riboside 5'-monophosphate phosphoribohydrolase n=1 Tax=Zingiber officinale TaxID=94328 RepID=A0A8J5FCZ3_ZINOF|nr:hypothetical protein ZIOFF_060731 [Zingiber officinale]
MRSLAVSMETEESRVAAPPHSCKSRFRRVCVFCGSSRGKKEIYQIAATQLGQEPVQRKIDLVVIPRTLMSSGYGTLEELLKVITWAQLGIRDKLVERAGGLAKCGWDYEPMPSSVRMRLSGEPKPDMASVPQLN